MHPLWSSTGLSKIMNDDNDNDEGVVEEEPGSSHKKVESNSNRNSILIYCLNCPSRS
jgi:hypothetical protein